MRNLELRIVKHYYKISILISQFLTSGLICCIMAFMPGICRAGEELRFQFRPGDKFSLILVTQINTTLPASSTENKSVSGGGIESLRDEPVEQTFRIRSDLDIEEVEPDGSAWAKYTYRQVSLKSKSRDSEVDYDSEDRRLMKDVEQDPLREQSVIATVPLKVMPWVSVINESFYLRITPQGQITNINGLAAVVGSAKSRVLNMSVRNQILESIEEQFTEDNLKRSLENQIAVFPDPNKFGMGRVGIGDTWSRKQRENEDHITIERTYKLMEYRDGVAVLDVNIIVASDANAGPVSIDGMKAERELSGRGTGQIEIEQSSGQILNSTMARDLIERIKFLSEGAFRRSPSPPAPARTHLETTFQMIRRGSDLSPPLPEVNQPAPLDF